MNDHESNKLLKGALILTLAGLLSKVLSASYRIPLQNLTGDIGFYIYQQVYPIVGVVIVLSLYGFPQAISKLTADLAYEQKSISFKHFALPLLLILFIICFAIFFLLFFSAGKIASLAGDLNLEQSYQMAAFTFLFIPVLALCRGVLQGNGDMQPTAYSQVGEQLFRVCIIVLVALFVASGKLGIYSIGRGASVATMVGLTVATLVTVSFIIKRKRFVNSSYTVPWKYYIKTIFTLGFIASLNHMVLLGMQLTDAFTLIPNLIEHGYTKLGAMEQKGVFDRGQPLIQIGAVLGSSFALALVPSVSKKKLKDTPRLFYNQVRGALLVSLYLGIGATVGLIALFPEVNELLYQNIDGTRELQILSLSILLCSLSVTCTSILQGFGYAIRTAGFIFIAFSIKWIANALLVPHFGIAGSAISTVGALGVLCSLVFLEMKKRLPHLYLRKRINGKTLLVANFLMISLILVMKLFVLPFVITRLEMLLFVVVTVSGGAFTFILTLIRGRVFTKQEFGLLPFAAKFIHIHKERKEDE